MSTVVSLPWLDRDFLETALKSEIDSYEVTTMGATGDGFTSSLYRVKADLKPGQEEYMIVKRLSTGGNAGKCMQESSMFARETELYEATLPRLVALLEKALPGKVSPMAPRHIYSTDGTILMEDLTASGFKMLSRQQGMDLDHCLMVMRIVARFHAASVILEQQDPDSMKLYSKTVFSEPIIQENLYKFFLTMVPMFADEVETWPEYGEKYAKKLRAMADKMVKITAWAARRQDGRFNVLTHDDLWVNNVMFRPPDEVRMVDFQMPHFASPGNDLQLFFVTSLSDDVRENHIDDMLMEYYKTLCDTLKALGYKKTMITMEELKKEYALSSLYGMAIAVVYLPSVLAPPDYEVAMFDSQNVEPDNSVYNNSRFKDVMRKMLKRFIEQGAFNLAKEYLKENSS